MAHRGLPSNLTGGMVCFVAVLHESPWYRLERVAPGALSLLRTSTPWDSLGELGAAHEPLLAALDAQRAARLLIDLRAAPSRNDPEFEERFERYRARLTAGGAQTGLLLRTRVGALQVQRLARNDGVDLRVFHEEDTARTWLEGDAPS
ncbi:MAG: hypothetical protein H6719_05200 [Sandaracinaceae bacterium]|nr:hypothetical protein [Sandaracinaceae bacterium]